MHLYYQYFLFTDKIYLEIIKEGESLQWLFETIGLTLVSFTNQDIVNDTSDIKIGRENSNAK